MTSELSVITARELVTPLRKVMYAIRRGMIIALHLYWIYDYRDCYVALE